MTKLDNLLANTRDLALKRRAKWLLENIDIKKTNKVLDAGCGDGFYLFLLSQLFPSLKLVGLDYEQRGLDSAKQKLKSKKIKLIQGDLMKKLPFKDNHFDVIIMSEVIEHLPDDVKGLKEIRRILRPGGIILLSVPHLGYPMFWDPINWFLERLFNIHIKRGFFAGIWNQHERLYTQKNLNSVLKKAEFEVENIKVLTWWCLPFNHYIINMGARILVSQPGNEVFKSANKFSKTNSTKPLLFKLFFSINDFVDTINELWYPKSRGLSLVAKAKKI